MTEIQGKSILVRVSVKFELARVDFINQENAVPGSHVQNGYISSFRTIGGRFRINGYKNSNLFQALDSWGKKRVIERKNEGAEQKGRRDNNY